MTLGMSSGHHVPALEEEGLQGHRLVPNTVAVRVIHEGPVAAEWLQQEPHFVLQAAAAVDGLGCPGASLAPAVHHAWKNDFSLRVLKSTTSFKICGMSAAINPALQIQIVRSQFIV